MSNAYLSPILQDAQFADDGTFLSGGLIWFYVAGTSTPIVAYTGPDASTAWSNPIELNSRGEPGGEIWLLSGSSYKMVLEGPPIYGEAHGPVISTFDNITGVNDPGTTTVQNWVVFSGTPTYVSTSSFTVAGDQRSVFLKSRRLKTTNTAGTVYSTVISATYATSQTTVTVSNDYGQALDSGLSAISYGFIETGNVSSIPVAVQAGSSSLGSGTTLWIDYDPSIGLRWESGTGGLTSSWPIEASTAVSAATNSFATQQTASQGLLTARSIGANDVALVVDSTGWGVLQQSVGYGIQYVTSTGKYSYGGFTLPNPASSKYIQLPNGLIIQFGQGTASNAGTAVTFPTAFPSLCVAVVATDISSVHNAVSANSLSTTGFTAYCASTGPVSYIAFGY